MNKKVKKKEAVYINTPYGRINTSTSVLVTDVRKVGRKMVRLCDAPPHYVLQPGDAIYIGGNE